MKISTLREEYHKYTGIASDLLRKIDYSFIAIVWILCKEEVSNLNPYKWILLFLAISLAFDFSQYMVKGVYGQYKYQKEEKKIIKNANNSSVAPDLEDTEIDGYPPILRKISSFFYYGKFIFALIAVGLTILALIPKS